MRGIKKAYCVFSHAIMNCQWCPVQCHRGEEIWKNCNIRKQTRVPSTSAAQSQHHFVFASSHNGRAFVSWILKVPTQISRHHNDRETDVVWYRKCRRSHSASAFYQLNSNPLLQVWLRESKSWLAVSVPLLFLQLARTATSLGPNYLISAKKT